MLDGFAIKGFRSFGPQVQRIFPLEKINLIAGRNNVGKSNVLRLVPLLMEFISGKGKKLTSLDQHEGVNSTDFRWHIPFVLNGPNIQATLESLRSTLEKRDAELIESIIRSIPTVEEGVIWFDWPADAGLNRAIPDSRQTFANFAKKHNNAEFLWTQVHELFFRYQRVDFLDEVVPQLLKRIIDNFPVPNYAVHTLNAHRQIGQPGSKYEDLNGQGLIERLLELQNPERAARLDNRAKFDSINRFISEVLEAPDARIDIPYTAKELNVSMGNRFLPIESLGTGVHEVVIFAAAATVVENSILCIEEPEIHLHPRLQRKLLSYLRDHTSNQYFITTHSAALLDAPDSALFHLTLNTDGETVVKKIRSGSLEHSRIAPDLGYKASDLVQANCVIWVEGPSDRIYLNAWISNLSENLLVEGFHYTIMFYGGRLLSHLTTEDSSVNNFIELQKINRNVAIIIDSDKRKSDDQINKTKSRVLDEIEKLGGFGWITAGREMENYIEPKSMIKALNEVHPGKSFKTTSNIWACCYTAEKEFHVDKIALARSASQYIDFNISDLRSKMDGLLAFIKSANT